MEKDSNESCHCFMWLTQRLFWLYEMLQAEQFRCASRDTLHHSWHPVTIRYQLLIIFAATC